MSSDAEALTADGDVDATAPTIGSLPPELVTEASPENKGDFVPLEVKAQFDSLRAFFDPKASLDRLDSYAKWLFSSSAIVGALGAGFSNGAIVKAHGLSISLVLLSIMCLGISLASSCRSLAPKATRVFLYDLDKMRNAVNGYISSRQRYVTIAAWSYGFALVIAAAVPVVAMLMPDKAVKVTYAIDAKGALVADVTAQGIKPGNTIELTMEGAKGRLATSGAAVSSSGAETLHAGPVPLDPGITYVTVKEKSVGDNIWQQVAQVAVQH